MNDNLVTRVIKSKTKSDDLDLLTAVALVTALAALLTRAPNALAGVAGGLLAFVLAVRALRRLDASTRGDNAD